MREFLTWLNTMRSSINGYEYYVDFPKIYKNVEKLKRELCLMNSLIGEENIEQEFMSLLTGLSSKVCKFL